MFQSLLIALLLDRLLGEPRRAHPLIGFGRLAGWIEARLHGDSRVRGVLALLLAVAAPVLLASLPGRAGWPGWIAGVLILYLCIGLRSLGEHALPVAQALEADDLPAARAAVARMVSRDAALLDETQVAAAATESVLENGNDAVFGALFWFALAGPAGAVLYRLANTLDAMWGYRNARYERFGWAAARLDDVLNYVPARLTALSYALAGRCRLALACWRRQAPAWDSPNAGPVMAAGAGALGVRLGGAAPYEGQWHERPPLGKGEAPGPLHIRLALRLVRTAVVIWLAAALLLQWSLSHA